MTPLRIFDFNDYKLFLEQKLMSQGSKSVAANVMACSSSYLTKVLSGAANLSLEQAEKLCDFLEFESDQAHYFLLLVQYERAGTERLKKYFKKQIDEITSNRELIANRIGVIKKIDEGHQYKFFSRWYYAVIQVILRIPNHHTAEIIADTLNLEINKVRDCLEFMVEIGLAVKENEQYFSGPVHIHLDAKSNVIELHHENWRKQSLLHLNRNIEQQTRFSAVMSLDEKTVSKIKDLIIEFIKSSSNEVKESKPSKIYNLNVDFYELIFK